MHLTHIAISLVSRLSLYMKKEAVQLVCLPAQPHIYIHMIVQSYLQSLALMEISD